MKILGEMLVSCASINKCVLCIPIGDMGAWVFSLWQRLQQISVEPGTQKLIVSDVHPSGFVGVYPSEERKEQPVRSSAACWEVVLAEPKLTFLRLSRNLLEASSLPSHTHQEDS